MTYFQAHVRIGARLAPVGLLRSTKTGACQFSVFTYDLAWLGSGDAFAIAPSLSLEGGPFTRSLELAREASKYFGLGDFKARNIIKEMARKVSVQWRQSLKTVGVTGALAKEYEPAFTHSEADIALSL
jgi:hypothetical protein